MIIELLVTILTYVFDILLNAISAVLTFGGDISGYDINGGLGYLFGNLFLFDTILPVTEAFFLAGVALTFKAFLLGFEIFMFVWSFLNKTKTFFISWR